MDYGGPLEGTVLVTGFSGSTYHTFYHVVEEEEEEMEGDRSRSDCGMKEGSGVDKDVHKFLIYEIKNSKIFKNQ